MEWSRSVGQRENVVLGYRMRESGNSKSRARYYLRVLRPLFYWFVFVLILFGIRTHQRLMERTRLYFDLSMEGKRERFGLSLLDAGDTPFGAAAAFDGQPILSGAKVPLGFHTFTITHPKTVPFSTNLFIWYGGRNFGVIDLKRAKSRLAVTSDPPASLLFIQGPEYGITLTNTGSFSAQVPTDDYDITAQYPYWRWQGKIRVATGSFYPLKIEPRFGVLQLTCNQTGATYQLSDTSGHFLQSGDLPAAISELPEGRYQIISWHHNHEWKEEAFVRAGNANTVLVEFQYGTALLETTPSGATVFDSSGLQRGVTPLTISELQSGTWKFNLQLYNYEPVAVALSIVANETNTFRTNLVSQSYATAMRAAWQYMNDGKYDEADQQLTNALRVQPDDAAATAMQKEAVAFGRIAHAEALGDEGDYTGGIKELEKVLAALPENDRARKMLAKFKQHEPEQRARLEQQRIAAWTNVFNVFTEQMPAAALVETHELNSSKPAVKAEADIENEFLSVKPTFRLSHVGGTNDIFYMDADQEISGGGRFCMIVGGKINDNETRVRFKVIEFKSEALGLKILGAVLASAASTTYQSNFKPINPADAQLSVSDKNRVAEGVRLVTEKIRAAVDETDERKP